jgi:hypothetical protein
MSHQAIINNANQQVDSAQAELQLFMQKFEHVGDFNNGNISLSKNLVMATDISLSPSKDLDNTVVFSCSLNWNGDNYGVTISEDTQIIIILKDGTVHEYDLYNERYPYSTDVRLGKYSASKQAKILPHEFYNMTIKDISYIKLTGLSIWTRMGTRPETVADNYEIELYRASQ